MKILMMVMIGEPMDGAQDGMDVGNGMVGGGNGIMEYLFLSQHNDLLICGVVVHPLQSHLEMINIMGMIGVPAALPQSPLWMIYTTIGEEDIL